MPTHLHSQRLDVFDRMAIRSGVELLAGLADPRLLVLWIALVDVAYGLVHELAPEGLPGQPIQTGRQSSWHRTGQAEKKPQKVDEHGSGCAEGLGAVGSW